MHRVIAVFALTGALVLLSGTTFAEGGELSKERIVERDNDSAGRPTRIKDAAGRELVIIYDSEGHPAGAAIDGVWKAYPHECSAKQPEIPPARTTD